MILFSHSRCYPGVATVLETKDPGGATVLPGSTPDSPRCMPVSPGSTTVRPGVAQIVHGAVPVTAGRVTVCAGGVMVLPRFATVRPGLPRLIGISQCCYDGFKHVKTKLHTVHVRAYELACWYFSNRGNTNRMASTQYRRRITRDVKSIQQKV